MSNRASERESHALRGPTDRGALIDFRDAFIDVEPLAEARLDDPLNPDEFRITLADGVGDADSARIDVIWTTFDDYNIHCTDSKDRNLRWDCHPNDYPNVEGATHFHPPPDAATEPAAVEDSCIAVTEIELVARAVQKLWRRAYEHRSFEGVNDAENPP